MPLSQIVSDSIQDGAVAPVDLSSVAQYTMYKNRLFNGQMAIDQRNAGTAFSLAAGTNSYGSCDRWASIASAATWTLQQVSSGNYDFPYALRIKRTAASTASTCYVGQVIETNNCTDLAGQAVTLSFYVTAGANYSGGTFTVEIWTGTGTNQGWASLGAATWTGQTQASANTPVPTTTRTRYSYTATLGATITEVAVRFTYAGTGTAGANDYIDITGVQLEKGVTATSFDYRPYGTELSLCQRYYEVLYTDSSALGVVSNYYNGTTQYTFWQFQQTKRTSATVALASGASWVGGTPNLYGGTSRTTIGGITAFFYSTSTAGNPNLTASAEL